MQETWVWSLGWNDPLEKEMITSLVFLPGKIPWAEELGRICSTELQKSLTWLSNSTTIKLPEYGFVHFGSIFSYLWYVLSVCRSFIYFCESFLWVKSLEFLLLPWFFFSPETHFVSILDLFFNLSLILAPYFQAYQILLSFIFLLIVFIFKIYLVYLIRHNPIFF